MLLTYPYIALCHIAGSSVQLTESIAGVAENNSKSIEFIPQTFAA